MLDSISTSIDSNTKSIEISVKDENNSRATIIANEIINKLKEKYKESFTDNSNTIQRAEVPKEPYNINHKKDMGYPIAFGVCICICLVIITYIKNVIYDIYMYFKNRKNRKEIDDNNSSNILYDNLQRMRNVYDNKQEKEKEEDDDEDEFEEDDDDKYYYKSNKNIVEEISNTQKSISKLTQQNMNNIRYLDSNRNNNKSQIILKK